VLCLDAKVRVKWGRATPAGALQLTFKQDNDLGPLRACSSPVTLLSNSGMRCFLRMHGLLSFLLYFLPGFGVSYHCYPRLSWD
jgi:hypothetical protein